MYTSSELCAFISKKLPCSRAVSHPSVFARAVSVVTFCPSKLWRSLFTCNAFSNILFAFHSFPIPAISTLAFSTPALWCRDFHSRVFHHCSMVPHFPLPRIQRPLGEARHFKFSLLIDTKEHYCMHDILPHRAYV